MANENVNVNQGGTATMDHTTKAPFGAGIRGVERTLGQQVLPQYQPNKEYQGKTQEWCLRFNQGQMATTNINERIRSCLAKSNIPAAQEDTAVVAAGINASSLYESTSDDGTMSFRSWRTDNDNVLWVLVRHFELVPFGT